MSEALETLPGGLMKNKQVGFKVDKGIQNEFRVACFLSVPYLANNTTEKFIQPILTAFVFVL